MGVYRAGQLGCFKQIQDLNPYKNDKGTLGVVSSFVAVTAARTVVMPFNYPFDTVRLRMMLQSEKPKADRLYSGSVDCFTKVLKNEGLAGMYKGLVPELFRGVGGARRRRLRPHQAHLRAVSLGRRALRNPCVSNRK